MKMRGISLDLISTSDLIIPKRIYVFAPNHRMFLYYMKLHHRQGYKWVHVYHPEKVYGLPRGTEVIWLRGDNRGDIDIPENEIWNIKRLCEMDMEGRINIVMKRIEEAP